MKKKTNPVLARFPKGMENMLVVFDDDGDEVDSFNTLEDIESFILERRDPGETLFVYKLTPHVIMKNEKVTIIKV